MAITNNNLNTMPRISKADLESGDPSRLNRILNLLASKIPTRQDTVTLIETVITAVAASSGSSSGGGSSSTSATIVSDTHANRLLSFPATDYDVNSLFWETDREILYICQFPTAVASNTWVYALGTMGAAYASRPTDLDLYDDGFLFYATDKQLTYEWDGAAWAILSNFEPFIQDTHANRLTNYPSTFYATGTPFWETDRTILYVNQNATGTLTATGTTTVNWVSGDKFDAGTNWEGKTITINGIAHVVATTTSANQLVTVSAVAAGVGVTFTVASGKWQYAEGRYPAALASIPTDLLSSDDGFLFAVTDYKHVLQWAESTLAWTWGPGETGGGQIQGFAVDPSPTTGWILCDGTATNYLKSDGTTTNFTTPNLTTTAGYAKLGTPYNGTINAATIPLISGSTASGAAVFAGGNTGSASTGASIPANTGNDNGTQTVAAGLGATVPAEPHTHPMGTITDPGHAHTVADTGHTHTFGTLVNDALGQPPNIVLRPWFRR